jgi:hypothetical protein
MSLSLERVAPTQAACEVGIEEVYKYKETLEQAAKLPSDLYFVKKECYPVFDY